VLPAPSSLTPLDSWRRGKGGVRGEQHPYPKGLGLLEGRDSNYWRRSVIEKGRNFNLEGSYCYFNL